MEELDEEMIQFEKDHPSKKSGASGNGILPILSSGITVSRPGTGNAKQADPSS